MADSIQIYGGKAEAAVKALTEDAMILFMYILKRRRDGTYRK